MGGAREASWLRASPPRARWRRGANSLAARRARRRRRDTLIQQRLNAIFFYTLSVLGFLAFLAAGTTYWHTSDPKIELRLERIALRKIYGAGHDKAILSLGIGADRAPCTTGT